ncbi:hypothetical protein O0G71_04755 [Staphylococcus pseudintermedius]|uniref:hypothetical protein n=1 Tax=Staphylococcus pseudintermedius TaxID=283734 RepID=UPI0018F49E83|nr:hypothetical protein [Staphylococcus pseudintermedius]EJA1931445.1 hypothetical protein [Staphylococcus pseudintermedius]MBJ8311937.1 hypothetical protein [Staphylococcus pseudintermedius]MDE9903705.1 hypothetical protein [Staphylococcus pseudintermedius]MDF0069198.1 hypothetical protein [Staphylococcus pseudintermedius]MDF0081380.1 hypothetical protein [Staphylococcus pseudintermedius]
MSEINSDLMNSKHYIKENDDCIFNEIEKLASFLIDVIQRWDEYSISGIDKVATMNSMRYEEAKKEYDSLLYIMDKLAEHNIIEKKTRSLKNGS